MHVADLRGLTVAYGDKVAVQDFTCAIPEGCVGLLGPNGAGKSTLIRALLGFVDPLAGNGTVLGHNIATDALAIRMDVGLMPEMDCHIPGMTAVEFTAYAGELSGMPREQALRRAHEVLEYCGLGEARYRNLETYSTGMKQKAKLAQAVVHGPKLLFLDEPTNGLDPDGRDEMLGMIKDISHGKGVNVVLSSHLLPDIEKTCDEVIVMHGGKLRAQESVKAIRIVGTSLYDLELKLPNEAFSEAIMRKSAKIIHSFSTRYRVEFPSGFPTPTKAVFEAAKEVGAQVRVLAHAQRSLEEAFLEAVQ